jgi:hypothetical protein
VKILKGERSRSRKEGKAVEAENRRLRMLKVAVDTAYALILQANLTIDEALDIVNATKRKALALFPDKERTYDLIYGPRLLRAVAERFAGSSGTDETASGDRLRLNTSS